MMIYYGFTVHRVGLQINYQISNMKHCYKDKSHTIVSYLALIILTIIGLGYWGLQGLLVAIGTGCIIMLSLTSLWPIWATELDWEDIEIALTNLYGSDLKTGPEIIFRLRNKTLTVFNNAIIDKDFPMGISYYENDWQDIFDWEDIRQIIAKSAGGKAFSKGVFKSRKCVVIKEEPIQVILDILKFFVSKALEDIKSLSAREKHVSRSIWVSIKDQQKAPIPIVRYNFKGKVDGMTIFVMPSGEEKIITPEGVVDYHANL